MPLITYTSCPVCQSQKISRQLIAKDYTVSHESFEIWECSECTLRFTQNIPDSFSIFPYYKSDQYISHTDTREGLVNRLYHIIRKKTLESKKTLIEQEVKTNSKKLLDIGAGTGAFANHMSESGWQVSALEPDSETRRRGREMYNLEIKSSESLWEFHEGSFDVITMWHVLEHVHDLHNYISQIKKLLANNGKAFIAVPNYTSLDCKIYGAFWAAYDVPRHLYHFSPASMKTLLMKYGLQIKTILPMWYDSFYVSMLSEKYKKGNNHYISAMLSGLRSNLKAMRNKERCSSLIYIIEKAF